MTRLLFPEAFGLMAIVTALHVGVAMLSDVGIGQSIIVHREGSSPSFMDTAWVIQIIRGFLVGAILASGSSWAANFYGNPQLQEMILITAASALVSGFNSTKLPTADRQMQAHQRFYMDIGAQILSIAVMIIFAMLTNSPTSLAWGSLAGAALTCSLSHLYLNGHRNRLRIVRRHVPHILRFGVMILLSSALTFATGEGTKLLMGSLVDIGTLGVIGIAMTLSSMAIVAIQSLSARVLLPAYAQIHREEGHAALYRVLGKGRTAQSLVIWSISFTLMLFGQWIVDQLYDSRYSDAGEMLQILAIGAMAGALTVSYSGVLTAIGRPSLNLFVVTIQATLIWLCIFLGDRLLGTMGAVMGMSAASWLSYPFIAGLFARLGLWYPRFDLPILLFSAVVSAIYIYLHHSALGF